MTLSKEQKTRIVKAVYAANDKGIRLFPKTEPAKPSTSAIPPPAMEPGSATSLSLEEFERKNPDLREFLKRNPTGTLKVLPS